MNGLGPNRINGKELKWMAREWIALEKKLMGTMTYICCQQPLLFNEPT